MNGVATHGMWSDGERKDHINMLELKAALFGIQSLCRDLQHYNIRIHVDRISTTWVGHILSLAMQLLGNCFYGAKLSACHIVGKDNSADDSYSRKTAIHTERSLFAQLCSTFGTTAIDLFAVRTNHHLPRYMSLCPDPNAVAVKAFFHVWNGYVYIFPPFNLTSAVPRILMKLLEDGTEKAIAVVPQWKTQSWFPKLIMISVEKQFISSHQRHFYTSPQTWRQFTLSPASFI